MLLLAPLALAAARCTSPEPALYTLRPVPGTPLPGGPAAVKVVHPSLAGFLDRSEIVRRSTENRLELAGGERWAEPLADMIGRVLGLDLAQRLPGTTVVTESGALSVDAAVIVELDVQRFDTDPDGTIVCQVQAAVQPNNDHGPATTRTLRFTGRPGSTATTDRVAVMSGLVGQLADAVAQMLRNTGPMPLYTGRRR